MSETRLIQSGLIAAVRYCHQASVDGGWWRDLKTGESLKTDLKANFERCATKICLVHSELSESLEGLRKNKKDDHLPERDAVEVELADAVIRIFDLAGALDLDLAGAVVAKLAYNARRADHRPENRRKEGGKSF